MVDPAGRFFDNISGYYKYSPPILEVGIKTALEYITYFKDRFYKREGIYNWERK
jgi:radical S-adenosyl methionine domain-containing protein 2